MKQLLSLLTALLCCYCSHAQNIMSTVAGNGRTGYYGDEGMATDATFDRPMKVATDRAGNLYIPDYWNGRIRMVNAATGIITTVAGNGTEGHDGDGGPATAAGINFPVDVAVDSMGNIYIVSDSLTNGHTRYYTDQGAYVRKVDAAGIITTIAGKGVVESYSGDGGPATAAGFVVVGCIATGHSGDVYLGDDEGRIRKIDAAGIITTIAGNGLGVVTGDGGPATDAMTGSPTGIATDRKGNIYFTSSTRIRKIDAAGIISTVAGSDSFVHSGDGGPATAAGLLSTSGLAVDDSGNIYCSERATCSYIRKINAAGIISTIAGNGIRGNSGDGGPADSAGINDVSGVAADSKGNVYLSDWGNQNIRMICSTCSRLATPNTLMPQQQLSVWPQPCYGAFSLQLTAATTIPASIRITDAAGRTIKELWGTTNKAISISLNASPGIYFVTVIAGQVKSSAAIEITE